MPRPRYELFARKAIGLTHLKWLSEQRVRDALSRGSIRELHDEFGRFLGYELIQPPPVTDEGLGSARSTASISTAEIKANAGLFGRSRTAHLDDADRMVEAANRKFYPSADDLEDFVERAQAKVRMWTQPAPGRGDRAVRVYPKRPKAVTA